MDRHEVPGPGEGEDHFQLFLAGVAGNVHIRQPLVHHVGALAEQFVDHGVHRLFVAGDGGGGDEDFVAVANLHLPVAGKGHPVQGAHGLALAAGGDDGHFVFGVFADVVQIHIGVGGQGQVAQLHTHLEDVFHAAAGDGHFAAIFGGHVKDLLHPVHVGSERCHDDALVAALELPVQGIAHLALAHGDARAFGVGGIHQQQQDALLPQFAQTQQVDHPAVDGGGVDLEVAGGQHHAQRGLDGKGAGVGDGVVHMDELNLEAAGLHLVTVLFDGDPGLLQVLVFLQLELHQPGGEGGAVHRHVQLPQHIGQGADVVLVGVGEEDAPDLFPVLLQIGDVGNDHVHPQKVLVGEGHAGVDDDHVAAVFQHGHVFADLVETAQRDDPQLVCGKDLGLLFLTDGLFRGLPARLLVLGGEQGAGQAADGLGGGLCGLLSHLHGLLRCLAGGSGLGRPGGRGLAATAAGGGHLCRRGLGLRLAGRLSGPLSGLVQRRFLFCFCHTGIMTPLFPARHTQQQNPRRQHPPAVCAAYGFVSIKSVPPRGAGTEAFKSLLKIIAQLRRKCKFYPPTANDGRRGACGGVCRRGRRHPACAPRDLMG